MFCLTGIRSEFAFSFHFAILLLLFFFPFLFGCCIHYRPFYLLLLIQGSVVHTERKEVGEVGRLCWSFFFCRRSMAMSFWDYISCAVCRSIVPFLVQCRVGSWEYPPSLMDLWGWGSMTTSKKDPTHQINTKNQNRIGGGWHMSPFCRPTILVNPTTKHTQEPSKHKRLATPLTTIRNDARTATTQVSSSSNEARASSTIIRRWFDDGVVWFE